VTRDSKPTTRLLDCAAAPPPPTPAASPSPTPSELPVLYGSPWSTGPSRLEHFPSAGAAGPPLKFAAAGPAGPHPKMQLRVHITAKGPAQRRDFLFRCDMMGRIAIMIIG
jgi:hypothetical protein